jgi:hypothetical protein
MGAYIIHTAVTLCRPRSIATSPNKEVTIQEEESQELEIKAAHSF